MGTPRGVGDKTLVTVPWPISTEKIQSFDGNCRFLELGEKSPVKKVKCMRPGALYDTAKKIAIG